MAKDWLTVTDAQQLGSIIAAARERKGMTLADLSKETGLPVPVLRLIEQGKATKWAIRSLKMLEMSNAPAKLNVPDPDPEKVRYSRRNTKALD